MSERKAGKAVVNVEATASGFNPNKPEDDEINPRFSYKVVSLKNTITPKVFTILKPKEVQSLIDSGIEVNVK